MNKKEDIDRRINNSVRWLNTVDPDWLSKVNTETLNMTTNCILDQVFGNYEQTIEAYPELKNQDNEKQYLFSGRTNFWKDKINTLKSEAL